MSNAGKEAHLHVEGTKLKNNEMETACFRLTLNDSECLPPKRLVKSNNRWVFLHRFVALQMKSSVE